MKTAAQAPIEIVLLLTAAALVWTSAFGGAFQFDDFAAILQDSAYAGQRAFLTDLPHRLRPVTRLSLLLDVRLFGSRPAGYHLQSVLLHAGCALLLCDILRQARLAGRWTAFGAALLFVVHPIACETVTYISGRATGLSAFLTLLALRLYVGAAPEGADGRLRPFMFAASLSAFALALGAKETAASLPLLLLAWDAIVRREPLAALRRRWLHHHLPYGALLAAAVLAALSIARYRELAAFSLALRAPWDNLVLQAKPLGFALLLFVRPDLLNIDHDLAPAVLADPSAWAAAALLAVALVAALRFARALPALGFGAAWFAATALAANGPIARLDLLSERNLYLPCMGLAIAAAALASLAVRGVSDAPRWRAVGLPACAGVAVIAGLGTATVQRNALWSDPVALWSDAVAKSPRKSRAHDNLGFALERQGDLDGAIASYRRALDLDANNAQAADNLQRAWRASTRR